MRESGEMYLETILLLKKRQGVVRSVDIAREMGFSKPSVSRAMGILKKNGFITIDRSGEIELTATGQERAELIYDRHQTITTFLQLTLELSEEQTEEDACKIEHILSEEVFLKMKDYIKKHS